ncbi:MAG: SGNH/GDSL hydrolase family protein [Candidatus Baltobacteraceae bacterium]
MLSRTAVSLFILAILLLAACSSGSSAGLAIPPIGAPPTPGAIAFVGDSITAGVMLPGGGGTANPRQRSPDAFPYLVGTALKVPVFNLGIGGELIGQAITDEVPNIPANVQTVVTFLGTNNVTFGAESASVVTEAESEETALIKSIRARVPAACLVLITLPNGPYAPWMWANENQFDAFLLGLKMDTLDLRTESWTTDGSNFEPDGVHPNLSGNSDLAQGVVGFLRSVNCL